MLLHISDLHIGRDLNGFNLIEDQRYVLNQIVDLIKERNIKYLVLAGDIFDKYNPSNEAFELFEEFVINISKLNIRTIIISGNHDSKARLSYLSTFLKMNNIFIFTDIYENPKYIDFDDDKLSFLPLPYVNYNELKYKLNSDESNEILHKKIIDNYFNNCKSDYKHICIAHNLITGAKLSDSERTLSVGGLDELSKELFERFDYTALGHLHIRQNLGNNIYYSGSLLKYSVSEFTNINTINLYDYENNKLDRIELKTLHNYRIIKDYFDNILLNASQDKNNTDYISIELKDSKLIYDAYGRLVRYYPNLVGISIPNLEANNNNIDEINIKIENKSELEIFKDYYKHLLKKEISNESLEVIKNIIDGLNKEDN